ncbi:MAG: 4Fe-4S dicluster domain-containing protein [Desulfobacterales bacterium]|nr:4Fe-4S dicluster domain-containing protein [Desulfobacterales bacterium]
MKIVKIDKKSLSADLDRLRETYRLFGPVKGPQYYDFQLLGPGQTPDLDFLNTRMSAKSLVYPQSEVMLDYSLDESQADHHIMKESAQDYSPRAVIGIRPCDVKGYLLVKRNFDTPDFKDPYWVRNFGATTLVGYGCDEPCSSCFCTSAGSGPFHEEGLDVLLIDTGDSFLAKILSEKGEKLAAAAGWDKRAADGAEQRIEARRQAAEAKVNASVETDRLAAQNSLDLYDAPFWEDVSFSCINCGTCTYVCPTCWCFDIQDEVRGKNGKRLRIWDSCMYPLFTLHGSGHNPRGTKLQRVRQRFMHKLKYYVDKYDDGIQCSGCGRCVRLCPVNIDIRRVARLMNSHGQGAVACEVK